MAWGLKAQDNNINGVPREDDKGMRNFQVKAPLTEASHRSVGKSASLKAFCPTPRSQNPYGTCTSWAVAYTARTILEAKRLGLTKQADIDKEAFSPGFNHRSSMPDGCNSAFLSVCVKNLQEVGVPKMSDYQLPCPPAQLPQNLFPLAAKHKIQGYARLWTEDKQPADQRKIDLVKKSLDGGNPVVVAMYCPRSFSMLTTELWTPRKGELDNPANFQHQHGRHALCVIGYDDNKFGGAFEVQNSWGTRWGKGGFGWVSYKDFSRLVMQAIELMDFSMPPSKEVVLSGALRLQLDTKQEMRAAYESDRGIFRLLQSYRSGTRFRIYINNNEPAFVYAFGSDNTGKLFTVFPHEPDISPALPHRQNEVALPSETNHIRMDNTVGKDYLCLLYTKEPLDIEDIQRQIQRQPKNISLKQKVENVLGNRLMSGRDVRYNAQGGRMNFTAKAQNKTIAMLLVEIDHIP